MKKSLIALAALAATASFAQSSVTIFGVADAAYTNAKTGGSTTNALTSGNQATSRLGLKGEEDLGGGMKAGFWLEAQLNMDSGVGSGSSTNNQASGAAPAAAGGQGLVFNRRSTASLKGNFGEVRLGRDYTPQFWNLTLFDPFGTVGVGANAMLTGIGGSLTAVRASNSIGYLTPTMSGFQLQLQTYMGENKSDIAAPADKKTGSGNALRATYANGPLSLAVASSSTDTGVGTTWKATNLAGSYDLGMAKLMAQSSADKVTGASDIKGFLVGATVPMGAGTIKLAYSETKQDANKADKTAVGYVYGLSKRTSLYATYASVKNTGASKVALGGTTGAAGVSSTGFDLGVTHSF